MARRAFCGEPFLALVFGLAAACLCAIEAGSVGGGGRRVPHDGLPGEERERPVWRRITGDDFHSELGRHEFALCIATVPWCGESRKLMKGILRVVGEDGFFAGMRFFVVYTNRDRLLGKVIIEGGSGAPGFALFRYGTPHRYNGIRSAGSIMAAVRRGMAVLRSDSVLLRIQSSAGLEAFPDSADKAIILCDFCGWERELRQEQRRTDAADDADGIDEESSVEDGRESGGGRGGGSVETSQRRQRGGDDKSLYDGGDGDLRMVDLERTVGDSVDQMPECIGRNTLGCVAGSEVGWAADGAELSDEYSNERDLHSSVNKRKDMDGRRGTEASQFQAAPFCSEEEYEMFKAVYHNVSRLAADWILAPHKIRFAIVSSEKVASEAGISTQGRPWLLFYVVHDFDRLPYFFDGVGDVEEFLSDHSAPLVVELDGDSVLPNDVPSVILFIDRMSNSTEVREQSKQALDVFEALSYHYASVAENREENSTEKGEQADGKKSGIPQREEEGSPVGMEENSISQLVDAGYGRLMTMLRNVNPEMGRLREGEGVFFELLSEPKNADGEIPGSPETQKVAQLQVLEEKVKQSLAGQMDPGLIPMLESNALLQKQANNLSPRIPGHRNDEDLSPEVEQGIEGTASASSSQSSGDVEELVSDGTGFSEAYAEPNDDKDSDVSDASGFVRETMDEACLDQDDCRAAGPSGVLHPLSSADENSLPTAATADDDEHSDKLEGETREEGAVEELVQDENEGVDNYWDGVRFFFLDGEDQMKEKLTWSTATPALVIINPQQQAHYVAPSNVILNISSLFSFLDSVFSGLLARTVFSGPPLSPPRQPPRPPFVNQDFHEINPVPRVSVDSFSKLVTGLSETETDEGDRKGLHRNGLEEGAIPGNVSESAWDKDVVVLFTTPWCGFCKRMELVVREIYRSFQLVRGLDMQCVGGFVNSNSNDPTSTAAAGCAGEQTGKKRAWKRSDAVFGEPPVLMQMDCALNDCSHYLKEIFEEESYPAVVLFPARNKLSPVVYDGAPTVQGIYNYLKSHRTATNYPQKGEGNTGTTSRDGSRDRVKGSTAIKIASGPPGRKPKSEALALLWQLDPRQMNVEKHANVGSFLLATEKLSSASPPFERAIVLIVSTTGEMVHGLIVNKPMAWKNVQGLDGKVEGLLNTAALGYGGPVVENRRPLLILTRLRNLEGFTEIVPGLYYGSIASESSPLHKIDAGTLAVKDCWFFLGYSSWAAHQLQLELAQDFWQVSPFTNDLVRWPAQWSE